MSADPYYARVHIKREISDALKVALQPHRVWQSGYSQGIPLTRSFPLFKSQHVHRVRRGVLSIHRQKFSRFSVDFWCGGTGSTDNGRFLAHYQSEETLCVKCEAVAVRRGLGTVDEINRHWDRLIYPQSVARAERLAS